MQRNRMRKMKKCKTPGMQSGKGFGAAQVAQTIVQVDLLSGARPAVQCLEKEISNGINEASV